LFQSSEPNLVSRISIVISVFVGAITFSGSIVAMAKLQGWLSTPAWTQSSLRHVVNISLAVAALIGAVPTVIFGGVSAIVAALVWMRLFPSLRDREKI
jgi:NAD(P) transhydrogenase subunit beta